MDLIGSIKYIESRFGGRNRKYGKGRFAQKPTGRNDTANDHNDVANKKTAQSAAHHVSAESDTRLGRQVNITV